MVTPEALQLIVLYDKAAAEYRKALMDAFENYMPSKMPENFALAKMNIKLCEDRIRCLDRRLKEQGEK